LNIICAPDTRSLVGLVIFNLDVHSMTEMTGKPIIGFKNLDAYYSTWKHPVKDPKRIRTLWRKYVKKQKQRIQAKKSALLE
jgi:hypothetical protein